MRYDTDRKNRKHTGNCHGIALLLTLGILLLLTLLALSFSSSQLTENQAATNHYYTAKAEEMALGGLESAIAVLREDARDNPYDRRSSSDHLRERWAIYYDDDDGFACKRNAKDSEAVDLSDYDELAYRMDETGDLDVNGMKDPWKWDDPERLDSRWINVMATDPVTGQERLTGRFAVYIEDENAKANINTAGNPDPMAAKNGRWSHRQNTGFTTAEINLGDIFNELGFLFDRTLDNVRDYPYNVDERTALDMVAYRYGIISPSDSDEVSPGRVGLDDNRTGSGGGRIRRTKILDLLAQDENGIDDDGDGLIDERNEGIDEPGEFDPYKPMEIKAPGELMADLGPQGTAGLLGDDTPYLTTSHAKMARRIASGGSPTGLFSLMDEDLKPPYPRDRTYQALLPYITVYSQDLNRFSNIDVDIGGGRPGRGSSIEWMPRLNIGYWLDSGYNNPERGVDEVYKCLRWMSSKNIAFRSTSDDLLKQIAVNIYDFIDRDWFPTMYKVGSDEYIGIEPTAYINEVDPTPPDVPGSVLGIEGWVLDWGEYIELYNPYDVPIDISRYRVTIDENSDNPGQGKEIRDIANGQVVLLPRSFYVIGDRRGYVLNTGGTGISGEQSNLDGRPAGCNAYDNLKLDAPLRMVLEMDAGRYGGVRLIEQHSNMPVGSKANISVQKEDPRLSVWNAAPQTMRSYNPGQAGQAASFYLPGIRSRARDPQWNSSDLDLLSHAGALHTIGELSMVHRGEPWRTLNFTGDKQLGYSDTDSDDDIRLLDVLTLPHQYRLNEPVAVNNPLPSRHAIPGRININTASPQVLMGLNWGPFIIGELRNYYGLRVTPALRAAIIQHIVDRRRQKPYRNLADVADDLVEFMDRTAALRSAPEGAKEAFMRHNSNLITTRSTIFKVTVLAQVFDRRGNVSATRKLEAVLDRGYTPGSLDSPDPDDKDPDRIEQARAETARTLYFHWITQD